MFIAEWANRELEVLKGQLAYLNTGAARFYDALSRDTQSDRTDDCVAMVQRQIEYWKRLMSDHRNKRSRKRLKSIVKLENSRTS